MYIPFFLSLLFDLDQGFPNFSVHTSQAKDFLKMQILKQKDGVGPEILHF